MTRRKGGLLLLAGAVCLLAALGLTGWNLYEQARAGETAQAAAEQLVEKLVETPEEPEEPEEPDPNRPMPVVEVDGLTYIGLRRWSGRCLFCRSGARQTPRPPPAATRVLSTREI